VAARVKGRRRRAAWIGRATIAASVLAHLAVFLVLFSHFGSAPNYAAAPVMSVELLTRPPATKPPRSDKRPRRPGAASKTASPPQEIALHPTPPAPSEVAPSTVPGRAPGDVQAALRGLVGCSPAVLAQLSREQRGACEQQLARREVADLGRQAGRLNLDLGGAFGQDPRPYLERRPTNGCKPRAGGDVAPMGKVGAAAGIACAKSF
jgi:hypothetical protein